MNRRQFLSFGSVVATAGLAGCSDSDNPSKQDSGGTGGPQTDYEKAVNTVNGETYVDLHLRSWFSCSYANTTTVTFTINFIAAGKTIDSQRWTVEFEDCMNEHTKDITVTLPEQYEEVLVSITDNWSDGG